ncbi:MAG: ABC transporter permease [Actinomycetota bacterium]|nr:ABC transporter permease [Actinomycetota bacterium]
MTKSRIFWGTLAPVAAILSSLIFVYIILTIRGVNPIDIFAEMVSYGFQPRNLVSELNQTIAYYMAGVAAAIGFKMLLFNIGIDGQYRMGAFFGAVVGAAVNLPPILHVTLIIITAMLAGGLWAAIAGYLKVRRGISEVISNIMLNFIAAAIIAFLLSEDLLGTLPEGSQNLQTRKIPLSGQMPTIKAFNGEIYSFLFVAIAVGIAYWVMLNKTVFGFNLRATGLSFRAARSSGVNAPGMIFITTILSGAIAGLVGIGTLLSDTHSYSMAFPAGYAFTGLALALLGRNHPVGIFFAAFLWSFLERTAPVLEFEGVPPEITIVMQGTIVLSIVVAYELVARVNLRQQQRAVGKVNAEASSLKESL